MHLGYLILIQDETQQVITEALLRECVELDGLTGVLNQSSFDEQLHRAVEANAYGSQISLPNPELLVNLPTNFDFIKV